MKASQRVRRGFKQAKKLTNKSNRQISLDAGYNENLVNLFMTGQTDDMFMNTLDDVCQKGLGMTLDTIWRMGKS